MVKTEFTKNCRATQQKGRGVPIHLQEQVEQEIIQVLDQDHVKKLEYCSDKKFVSRIVKTVRRSSQTNWRWI